MQLRELFLKEDDRSTAVFAFGRFNPPTIGHQKLIETVLQTAEKANGKAYLFLSHKQNNKTDPLNFAEKQAYRIPSTRCGYGCWERHAPGSF